MMIDMMYFQTSRSWLLRMPITGWTSELTIPVALHRKSIDRKLKLLEG
ncbi:hypothetical protein FHS85_000374 [Rhodoligotrophos appendicifer]|nr:hypothetical protein [Rhodoligotrophos appendicifer]